MSNHARIRAAGTRRTTCVPLVACVALVPCASLVACALLVACAPAPRESTFDSPVPGGRLDAIDNAVRAWRIDHDSLPDSVRYGLVESLRSDDPLVRFEAIGALREITGEDRGYRYDDPAALRDLAIKDWVEWAKQSGTEHAP